ncbi:pentapeptide repeat-containing protein [Methylotenera sp.]|uniref:pentapeptide repeat-containing protein n=1 Tax=Methylotenera sp. TaxID=2051956 RepID=UPI00248715D7|nr:pentapeptide repeat-containing protein [Methylotenera sp.]MDI1298061.1 pentapeptide repeat-containing protein [Methylotenera sp.]
MNIFKQLTIVICLSLSSYSYAAEFNNQCTNGLSQGISFTTNCEIKEMYNGKTYCFSSESAKAAFLANPQAVINKASAFYAKNADKTVVDKTAKDVEPEREKISQADALKQINSQTCDLSNKDAGYLEFDKMDLRHCKMVNTSFFGAYLRGANLSGANMQKSYLNLARLEDANLGGADLTDATIFQAIFDKTNFQGANLTNARMIGTLGNVNMSDATVIRGRFGLDIGNQPMGAMRFDAIGGKFAHTNFEGADINRSNFRFADFRGANLRNTDLFRADFSKADLTGADITGAKFGEAILDGTIMTNVKGLEAIKGYEESKGKCVDCTIAAVQPESKADALQKVSAIDMMNAENPAMKVCNIRGARF